MNIKTIIDFVLHVDKHLLQLTHDYGQQVYLILFAIIFSETGLIVLPFLPGDSLLFAAGTISANPESGLSFPLIALLLFSAAMLGDSTNYVVGRFFGKKLFANPDSKIFKKAYLDKTHAFFEKHGGKALILARFAPIVRTFAPFAAGMGEMPYLRFLTFSLTANLLWVGICAGGGYLFGNIPVIQHNFEKVVLGIVVLSFVPMIIEIIKHSKEVKNQGKEQVVAK